MSRNQLIAVIVGETVLSSAHNEACATSETAAFVVVGIKKVRREMKYLPTAALATSIAAIAFPSGALAQMWTPGTEIVGQSVQVDTGGIVNTVYFDQGGVARITSPAGRSASGRWSVANQQLCLDVGTGSAECWPYRAAFETGKAVTLTSNCNVSSQWTANNTNIPERQIMPERG